MAPSKDRQRKLARAKFDRQMARRAVRERRRRRVLAGAGTGLAVLLIAVGGAWIGGAFDSDETTTEAADTCLWAPQDKTDNADLTDVGTPPTKDLPETGTETMTIATNQGDPITVSLDVASSPCGAASFSYLAGKKFFDNTDCHEIISDGAVHCGDPSGTGQGGPTYSFYGENVPSAPEPDPSASAAATTGTVLYPKGTVALTSTTAGNFGSQFLIFFKDFTPTTDPAYSIVGQVTGGLDTLAKIGKITTVANDDGDKVKPKEKITINTLTVGADAAATAAPSASAQS